MAHTPYHITPSTLANLKKSSNFVSPQDVDIQNDFANLGGAPVSAPDSVFNGVNSNGYNLNDSFGLGLNMGTLQLGTAAFDVYNGLRRNKLQGETNDLARAELAQNAKSFDINTGMQLATLQAEEARRNAYAGGFLDNSQRSDRFKDYDLQKLSLA